MFGQWMIDYSLFKAKVRSRLVDKINANSNNGVKPVPAIESTKEYEGAVWRHKKQTQRSSEEQMEFFVVYYLFLAVLFDIFYIVLSLSLSLSAPFVASNDVH
eukprot:486674_1